MAHFLAIQSTYSSIEYALFQDKHLMHQGSVDKLVASSMLIPHVHDLLCAHEYTLNDLDFIAVNLGPAPFTTLRVVIATINGIAYAHSIPLVGVNGFDAWFYQVADTDSTTAILLNAFNQEVYVATRVAGQERYTSGYGPVHEVAQRLAELSVGLIRIMGNGLHKYQEVFQHYLADRIVSEPNDPEFTTIRSVAMVGLEAWTQGRAQKTPLTPLYLKSSNPQSSS